MAPAFAAVTAFAIAAERRCRIELVIGIGPNHAGFELRGDRVHLRALLAPDARGKPIGRVIGLGDRLGRRAERGHREHRPEHLDAAQRVGLGDVAEQARPQEVARVRQRDVLRLEVTPALALAGFDQAPDLVELGARVDRADVGVLVERVAHAQLAHARLELVEHACGHRFLDQQARTGAAHVPLVEENAADHAFHRLVECGVGEDQVRRLAAEFERELLAAAGDAARDDLADVGAARECDLAHEWMGSQRGTGRTCTGDDVDDTFGQARGLEDLDELERGQRRLLGGFEHHRVAAGECRCDLPRRHQQREVPRNDLAGDAERRELRARYRIAELVGPTGVVEEVRRHQRDVDVACLADRLAVVERLQHREFTRALLDQSRDAEQVAPAFAPRQLAPSAIVRAFGGAHRGIDVGGGRLGDLRQHLQRRRVDAVEIASLDRLQPLPADVELVAWRDRHDLVRFDARGVVDDEPGHGLGAVARRAAGLGDGLSQASSPCRSSSGRCTGGRSGAARR